MNNPKYTEERSKVLLGSLPDDFLRVHDPSQARNTNDSSHIRQLAQQQSMAASTQTVDQIIISIAQANLVKNYSLTKMDPYVRLRIGHSIFETHSDLKGGKFPKWNKTISTYLPNGIKTIHIEVFDENTITPDERIAYADYVISEEVLKGKFMDDWIPLSGKQGVDKEGSINITICIRKVPYWQTLAPPVMVVPQPIMGQLPYYVQGTPLSVQYQPQPMQNPNYAYPPQPQPYRPTEEDIKQIQEMFPHFDKEVILGVLETTQGNKDQAITSLLTISENK